VGGATKMVAAHVAGPAYPPDFRESDYLTHGVPWLRTVLHLRGRLAMQGTDLSPYRVIGPRPCLSLGEDYVRALGDEPERCAGWAIEDILATEPPAAFAELWSRDHAEFLDLLSEVNNDSAS